VKTVRSAPSRRQFLAGSAGVGALFALAACGVGTDAGSNGGTGTLVVAWPNDADSLDPGNSAYSFQDWDLCTNLYETLVQCKFVDNGSGVMVWDGLSLAPGLAKSWETKGDTATFHLDTSRKFYPTGNPLTADDVIFSYQRLFDLGKQSSLNTAGIFSMDQIKKIDDATVKMTFKASDGKSPIEVNGFQLAVFRWPNVVIYDSVEVKKHITGSDKAATKWLKDNTAGTGPYYIANRAIGQQIQLAAVPNHPLNPAYKNVTITIAGNVLSLVKGGSVNLAVYGLTQEDVNSLSGNSAVSVQRAKAPEFYMLQLPVDAGGQYANQLVRQAIAYTIPYDEIIKSLFGGNVTKDLSMVTEGANGYTPAWAKYTTNLEKAKALMAQAGNPKVAGPLHFVSSDPTLQSMAILIKESAAKIGVNFTLAPETPASQSALTTARNSGAKQGPPDALLYKFGVWMDDPSITMFYFYNSNGYSNYPHWSDPTVDQISAEHFGTPPSDKRAEAWKKAQEIVAEACPIIPIVHSDRVGVTTKGITGFTISPEMCVRYWPLKPPAA
jgi:peptide/nickel transport system substrate-binding protein